ncbi:MAG: aminopeptidase [Bacillota bacterium]
MKDIAYRFSNGWKRISTEENPLVNHIGDDYKLFLNKAKTERECIDEFLRLAEEHGFVNLNDIIHEKRNLHENRKIYVVNKGKSLALFVLGTEDLEKGMHLIGAHVDAPRLDLKPFPLYEDGELALMKTHYYGGIKKYQWTSIPLALHGTIIKKDGNSVKLVIGEEENDPVLFITDLLPHLAKDQVQKKMGEGITGEGLNVLVGSIPGNEDVKESIKYHIIELLNEKYGIEEDDFLTAEIEVVPAGKAKDVGLDKSLIGGYGHDDRVCSYTAVRAILEVENPLKTAAVLLVDKEEIGSYGNTSMKSKFFENAVAELIACQSKDYSDLKLRRAMANTKALSADVGVAFDPNYPDVYDKRNTAFIGKGVTIIKYSGSRGKNSANDANAEFLGEIRKIFQDNDVVWQTGEYGKVDQGGGGTIAHILASHNAEVVDCGPPVLSMHAPMELVSKIDVYMTFKGYKAFLNR